MAKVLGNPCLILLIASIGLAHAQGPVSETERLADEEVVRYLRTDGVVYGSVITDSVGTILRRETYLRDSAGRIVQILIQYDRDKSTRLVAYGNKDWMEYPDKTQVLRQYNTDGSLNSEELRESGLVRSRTAYDYRGDPPYIAQKREEQPGEGLVRITEYNSRRLPLLETTVRKDGIDTIRSFVYDERDRLVEVVQTSGRSVTRVEYLYGEDGRRTEERFDATGVIVLRIREISDDSTVEEHFDGGRLFARVYRREGRVYREEILSGDRIVRLRETP